MLLLVAGILLWSIVHLSSSVAPGIRSALQTRIGRKPYRGIYSLLLLSALGLIVAGWRASPTDLLYRPPAWGYPASLGLITLSFVFFVAAHVPGNIRRRLRHPMLAGVALWALGHLLVNGEGRSALLFAALAAWAMLEILFINRRDGPREPSPPVPLAADAAAVVTGLLVSALLGWLHPLYAGVLALRL